MFSSWGAFSHIYYAIAIVILDKEREARYVEDVDDERCEGVANATNDL